MEKAFRSGKQRGGEKEARNIFNFELISITEFYSSPSCSVPGGKAKGNSDFVNLHVM